MSYWKVIKGDGVQAGVAKAGCNSPFVTLHYIDAETVVEEHNIDMIEAEDERIDNEREGRIYESA